MRYNSPATRGVTALCLEVHDLAIAKLIAGRPKDLDFCAELAKHRMIDERTLAERLAATTLDAGRREAASRRATTLFSAPDLS